MKGKFSFRRFSVICAVLLVLLTLGSFKAYAAPTMELSSDGGVVAIYDSASQVLTISGEGTVEYESWVKMARNINPNYFGIEKSWASNIGEYRMRIVFNGKPKAIKLCGTEMPENGLFRDFTGHIEFNNAVDLAPGVTDTSFMFCGAEGLNEPIDFETSKVENMSYMFAFLEAYNKPIKMDTSNVVDMSNMFFYANSFNQPLDFDTKQVTDMSYMFGCAYRFNQEVNFDTCQVENMSHMFYKALKFNQAVDFSTSKVKSMDYMFSNTPDFKFPIFFDISSLDDMRYMFEDSAVEQVILRNYANNQNIAANHAFKNCANLYYLSFRGLKNASITGFSDDYYVEENGANGSPTAGQYYQWFNFNDNKVYRVFLQSTSAGYSGFKLSADGKVLADYNSATNTLTISGAGVVKYDGWVAMAKLTNARYYGYNNSWDYQISEDNMKIVFIGQPQAIKLCGTEKARNGLFSSFSGTIEFNDAVSLAPAVTDLSYMFKDAKQFNESVNFDTSSVTNMKYMFDNASDFDQPVNFDTHNVTNMKYMFAGASSFNQPVNFDTRKVTDMTGMFQHAGAFNRPVDFDTRKVKDFSSMFSSATSFNHPVFFDISSAKDVRFMFYNSKVEEVLLENSAHQPGIYAANIFKLCQQLKYIQFSGLIHAKIDGFSGDYYVEEKGGQPTAHNAADPYIFTDNYAYRVYLQILEKPNVSAYRRVNKIIVKWTPVFSATGYEVYSALDKNGPFTLVNTTSALSHTDFYSDFWLKIAARYYKVRAYRLQNGVKEDGPFSEVVTWKDVFSPPIDDRIRFVPLE